MKFIKFLWYYVAFRDKIKMFYTLEKRQNV